MKLDLAVHTALDELRMQMLGAQVLFGFQLQSVFQDNFDSAALAAKLADLAALCFLVVTLGCLVAPPAQHRLVERGASTRRLLETASGFAEVSLAVYAIAIGLDLFAVLDAYWHQVPSIVTAVCAAMAAYLLWFGLGLMVRRSQNIGRPAMPARKEPELHEKIDQMLTESRVILPGAQALLGFQFVVTLTRAFEKLPETVQGAHFAGLGCVLLAVVLLIAPAAVHRVGFAGRDAERMHDLGSLLVTLALVPLAAGIATDVFVAFSRVIPGAPALAAAGASLFLLAALWYGLPYWIRARQGS